MRAPTRASDVLPRILIALVAVTAPGVAGAAPVPGTNVTYTADADFDRGTLINVNHDSPGGDQLQVNAGTTGPLPFVNIAASARGTVIRIDAATGEIIGEYFTAPDNRGRDPSRTTVDQVGNVWVANRGESADGAGSVARVGLVAGGTRVSADGTPDPLGEFLEPPFQYNTCVDRHGASVADPPDGRIKTSRGLGHILPWPNPGGIDDGGGVSSAEDECIITYTRVTGTATRTVAVDTNNDVWVGGFDDLDHEKLSGVTGLPVPGTQFNLGCGGYGGLIDGNGVLWSARGGGALLRFDTGSFTGECLDSSVVGDYGLGIDPQTGEIWHTFVFAGLVARLAPDGSLVATYPHGGDFAQGVAVDGRGNVWVAHSLFSATTVGHLRTDGTFVGNVDLPGGDGPTGVAVDASGKVWVANINSNNAMRIDPDGGPTGGGGFPVGEVDLTVSLGEGAGPYNYSDMTGSVALGAPPARGSWTVVQDSGAAATAWGRVTWNTEPEGREPAGSSIAVAARASDTEAGLTGQPFTAVSNGGSVSLSGRFIEVQVRMTATGSGESPVLSDLAIRAQEVCGNCVDDDGDGSIDLLDPDCASQPLALTTGKLRLDADPHEDRLLLKGHVTAPAGDLDPAARGMTVSLSDGDGLVACLVIPAGPGWTTRPGPHWAFKDRRDDSLGDPEADEKVSIKFNPGQGRFDVKVRIKEAELSDPEAGPVSTSLISGDHAFLNTQAWRPTGGGKRLLTP